MTAQPAAVTCTFELSARPTSGEPKGRRVGGKPVEAVEGALFVAIFAWFAILFTDRYPPFSLRT